ncbi:uncharacterized protein LOC132555514 [Ylistrum balloti]|uniref:uncharacterized protein LOC132555514 n=1 Tax=Ylistrum balloti TaxID=509963 RepID=UPI002905A0D8|nr:uncharacterized protein LOC132555514 [Ylistrum balloti]
MRATVTGLIFSLRGLYRGLVVPRAMSSDSKMSPLEREIKGIILSKDDKVVMFSKSSCPFCIKAKRALTGNNIKFRAIELDGKPDMNDRQDILGKITGGRSVPRVFINGKFYGGGDDTVIGVKNGKVAELLNQK